MGLFNWFKNKTKDTKSYAQELVNYQEIKQLNHELKDMATTLLSPNKAIKNARIETFEQAKNRLQLNEVDLMHIYKNYVYMFYISLIATVICFIGTLYNLFFTHNIFSAIVMLSMMSFCLANCFKSSFRAFQLKHQKLCSVKDWWDHASQWLPKL